MRTWMRLTLTMMAVGVVGLLFAAPTQAQRTGDHIVPSIETVCEGDPYNFGLCNAYCEALDCESPTPLGTPRACSNLLRNYKKKSGGAIPPCGCPCNFNLVTDLGVLGDAFFADEGVVLDIGSYQDDCGDFGPNGEPAFLAEVFEDPEEFVDPQGVRLFYWLTPGDEENDATCNKEGGGLDGELDDFFDWAYGPYTPPTGSVPILTDAEFEACEAALEFLCSVNN